MEKDRKKDVLIWVYSLPDTAADHRRTAVGGLSEVLILIFIKTL